MKRPGQYSIRDVAKYLRIPEHSIAYAHRSGKVAEPAHVAGKRIYTTADVVRVAKHFGFIFAEDVCSKSDT